MFDIVVITPGDSDALYTMHDTFQDAIDTVAMMIKERLIISGDRVQIWDSSVFSDDGYGAVIYDQTVAKSEVF